MKNQSNVNSLLNRRFNISSLNDEDSKTSTPNGFHYLRNSIETGSPDNDEASF